MQKMALVLSKTKRNSFPGKKVLLARKLEDSKEEFKQYLYELGETMKQRGHGRYSGGNIKRCY